MLPSVEGARTRRSARFGLTAEERTAINILDAVPVVVWIVLSFAYRLRRQAALALRNAGNARSWQWRKDLVLCNKCGNKDSSWCCACSDEEREDSSSQKHALQRKRKIALLKSMR